MKGRPARYLPPAAIVVLAVIVYLNSLPNEFIWDDHRTITRNPLIQRPGNIPLLFATDLYAGTWESTGAYRPLLMTTFAVDFALFGSRPWAFRAINLALHAAASLLLFYLLVRLLDGSVEVPFITALLFASHPVHTEAVAVVTGRAEPLSACLVLGAWLVYLRGGRRAVPVALLLFFLALLAKESAAIFPFLLAAGALFRRDPSRRVARDFLLAWGVFLVYVPVRLAALGGFVAPEENILLRGVGLFERIGVMIPVFREYLLLSLFPVKLSIDYKFLAFPGSFSGLEVATGIVLLIAIVGLAAILWRSRSPYSMAILLFLLPLMPVSNVIPTGEIFGERLLYLPSIGACLVLALLWRCPPRPVGWGAILVAVLCLSLLTVARNRVLVDQRTLARATLHHYPGSYNARMDLGVAAYLDGDPEGAIRIFRENLTLLPDHAPTLENMGTALASLGRYNEAAVALQMAIPRVSPSADSWALLGTCQLQLGADDEALRSYREALRIDPDRRDAGINSGVILLEKGMAAEAEPIFRTFRERDRSDAHAAFHHARALEALGRREEAVRAYEDFLRVYEGKDEALRAEARERIRRIR